jgi:hypothetical protein
MWWMPVAGTSSPGLLRRSARRRRVGGAFLRSYESRRRAPHAERRDPADGMLWSSPMYQGTISGAFKNALDWLHVLGAREPAFLHDEVIGLIQRGGRNTRPAGHQHDGVRHPGRCADGPSRSLFPCRRRLAPSTGMARSRTPRSSCSSGHSAPRSCASPSGSRRTLGFIARANVTRRAERVAAAA